MKTRSSPEQSLLMEKWSSKPADHNAIRVRNNQRRHRARVKSRIEDLEKRLEETSARLDAALATIGGLTAEIEVLRGRHRPTSPMSRDKPPHRCARLSDPEPTTSALEVWPIDAGVTSNLISQQATQPPPPRAVEMEPKGTRKVITAMRALEEAEDGSDCNCEDLPPTERGESTLPCSFAFQIIKQQNASGIDLTTIRARLSPGFRKALRPGEACRVETSRVYELLDQITPTF